MVKENSVKIVYGIHGYGRGHVMRAMSVIPELVKDHELLILAGGDAHQILMSDYAVLRIPVLKYHYNKRGQFSNYLNIKRNSWC